ncbi:MAG: hypothetical protein HQ579_01710, partial [Candidatus Omnitrophica bacterium]|nr:hypothetical protein [Candidatus Omnitrophota bacterium]
MRSRVRLLYTCCLVALLFISSGLCYSQELKQDSRDINLKDLVKKLERHLKSIDEEVKARLVFRRNVKREQELREYFQIANELYAKGDLEGAKKEWLKALEISKNREMRDYIQDSPEREKEEIEKKPWKAAERKKIEIEGETEEEAEQRRLKTEKIAKEKAEQEKFEDERRAREEAEQKGLEDERRAREEAERKRLELERQKREEARCIEEEESLRKQRLKTETKELLERKAALIDKKRDEIQQKKRDEKKIAEEADRLAREKEKADRLAKL